MVTTRGSRWRAPSIGYAAMQFAVLASLLLLPLCAARAQATPAALPADEFAKQENIYRSRGNSVPEGYITSRTLSGYAKLLPAQFDAALKRLGPEGRWLDIGAGQGLAILEYYASYAGGQRAGSRARVIALSIEDRRTEQWRQRVASLGPNQIEYRFGKRLRDYTVDELGKFQVITDVYGGFSYTDQLSPFVEKVLALLEVEGAFFTLLQSVRLEDGKDDPTTWYLTELVDTAGRDVKVCSWLKSISCVKVSCDSMSTWEAPTELIHIRKVCQEIAVPRLDPLVYEAGTPPGRKFRLHR